MVALMLFYIIRTLGIQRPLVRCDSEVVFTGGFARNHAMVRLLQEKLGIGIRVPPVPDIVGALDAALYALKFNSRNS